MAVLRSTETHADLGTQSLKALSAKSKELDNSG